MAEDGEKALLPQNVTIDGGTLSITEVLDRSDIDNLAEKAISEWATRRAASIRAAALVSKDRLGPKDHKLF